METLNHGILRFNDECTLKIDFDQETDDMTVTRINDVTGEETVISGGGSLPNFLEPKEMIGTMTVDENKTLLLRDSLSNAPYEKLVLAFCPTAPTFKVIMLWRRTNNSVSYATGFNSTDYGVTSWNQSTWQNNSLQVGDIYYLFTGNNF